MKAESLRGNERLVDDLAAESAERAVEVADVGLRQHPRVELKPALEAGERGVDAADMR